MQGKLSSLPKDLKGYINKEGTTITTKNSHGAVLFKFKVEGPITSKHVSIRGHGQFKAQLGYTEDTDSVQFFLYELQYINGSVSVQEDNYINIPIQDEVGKETSTETAEEAPTDVEQVPEEVEEVPVKNIPTKKMGTLGLDVSTKQPTEKKEENVDNKESYLLDSLKAMLSIEQIEYLISTTEDKKAKDMFSTVKEMHDTDLLEEKIIEDVRKWFLNKQEADIPYLLDWAERLLRESSKGEGK